MGNPSGTWRWFPPVSGVVAKRTDKASDSLSNVNNLHVVALFNDWSAVQFLSQHLADASLAPRFYAGDQASALFLMEDLGKGERLDHILLGHDAGAAEVALTEFAALHGRLHALTQGKQDEYRALRAALSPVQETYDYTEIATTFNHVAEILSVTPRADVEHDLATVIETLMQPGAFLVLIQNDSCPNNIIRTGGGWRLLDFEGARFAHALLEGVYGLMPFPSCWCMCRLPERVVQRMQSAYRDELAKGCPAATDDELYYPAVTSACIYWMFSIPKFVPLINALSRRNEISSPLGDIIKPATCDDVKFDGFIVPFRLLKNDRVVATLSTRQRYLLLFQNLARILEQYGYFRSLGEMVHAMVERLHRLWPEARKIPYYPAFQTGKS